MQGIYGEGIPFSLDGITTKAQLDVSSLEAAAFPGLGSQRDAGAPLRRRIAAIVDKSPV
jgi:hypothetical protein